MTAHLSRRCVLPDCCSSVAAALHVRWVSSALHLIFTSVVQSYQLMSCKHSWPCTVYDAVLYREDAEALPSEYQSCACKQPTLRRQGWQQICQRHGMTDSIAKCGEQPADTEGWKSRKHDRLVTCLTMHDWGNTAASITTVSIATSRSITNAGSTSL